MKKILLIIFFSSISINLFSQNYLISSGGTVNTCSGTFYDSGGFFGNYGNNENYTMTICGTGANKCIRINFTFFQTQNLFDVLTVYNGTNSLAPLLGTYSNNTAPVVTPTGACLTFKFVSNANTTSFGWMATLSCATCSLPIELLFFNATRSNDTVFLDWKTALENNVDKFVIEKSYNGIDFNLLTSIKSENSANGSYYHTYIIDNSAMYLRLYSQDFNGDKEYSSLIFLYPKNSTEIKEVRIYNIMGNLCYYVNSLEEANNKIVSGLYIYEIIFIDNHAEFRKIYK